MPNSKTNYENITARTRLKTLTEVEHFSLYFVAKYRVINVNILTSGSYTRGPSQSEMTYRNNSNSQRLWIHNYWNIKINTEPVFIEVFNAEFATTVQNDHPQP